MASGILTLNSDSANFEAQIVWQSTANISGKNTLTLDYQVRRTKGGANSSPWTLKTTLTLEHAMAIGSPSITYTTRDENGNLKYIVIGDTTDWITLYQSTHTIYNSQVDGKCSVGIACEIAGVVNTVKYDLPKTIITLDPYIKAATIVSAPNFNDSDNPVLEYNNTMINVYKLEAAITDPTGTIYYANYRDIDKISGIYTFYLTSAERSALIAACGNNTTLPVRFYIRTTVEGLPPELRSIQKTMTLVVSGPVLTVRIEDTKHKDLTGGGLKFIRGDNSMAFSMTATGQKGATIESVSVICGNRTIRSTSGTFTNIENEVVSFVATDSRNRTTTKTIILEPIDYIKLTCNQNVRMVEKTATEGQILLDVNGNYFNGSFGATNNTLKIYVRHRRNSEDFIEWEDITPLLASNTGGTYSLHTTIDGFDPSGTYYFECKAVDEFMEAATDSYPVQFIPTFDWGKNDFSFNVPVYIEGDLLADYVIECGQEMMGTNGTWYWRKWRSGRADCYGYRNYGNMGVSTAWGVLYRSEIFEQTLPSGLFIEAPDVIDITFRNSNFGAWIAKHEDSEPSTYDTGSFIVVRPASATLSQARISFNVIGRWK